MVSGTLVTDNSVLSSNTKLQITDATKIDVPSALPPMSRAAVTRYPVSHSRQLPSAVSPATSVNT